MSTARLVEAIKATGHPSVTRVERKDQLAQEVLPHLREGDMVLTLGAGDIWKVGKQLVELL